MRSVAAGGIEIQSFGHTCPVGGIALRKQPDLLVLDHFLRALRRSGDVLEKTLLVPGIEQAKQVAGLALVVS
jgi:hypothetical protein